MRWTDYIPNYQAPKKRRYIPKQDLIAQYTAGDNLTFTEKIKNTMYQLTQSDIDGCITGSSLISDDYDGWETPPDIDVFVYSSEAMIHAIDFVKMNLGFHEGKGNNQVNTEAWKIARILSGDNKPSYRNSMRGWGGKLSTVSLCKDGVVINISHKSDCQTVASVLSSFDMSIIMIGYDIPSGRLLDLRGDNKNLATPNPFRGDSPEIMRVSQWIRQFDRVVKYYNRGYDTRPMARFYLDQIDEVISIGAIFNTDAGMEYYNNSMENMISNKEMIEEWL